MPDLPVALSRFDLEEIVAVLTVAHEASQLAGTSDEAAAECGAVQRAVATMTSLGATRDDAAREVKTYLTVVYHQHTEKYRSDQCKSGGTMDLTPKDGTWP